MIAGARALVPVFCLAAGCAQVLGYQEPTVDDGPDTMADGGTPLDASDGPPVNIDAGPDAGPATCAPAPTFAATSSYSVGSLPNDVAAGDLDHDGQIDLAVANVSSPFVSIWHGAPGGTGALVRSQEVALPVGCTGARRVAVADLDADGLDDLAVGTEGTGCDGVYLIRQDKAKPGEFLAAVQLSTFPVAAPLVVDDLDGDTFVDLVFFSNGLRPYLQKADAPGTFVAAPVVTVGQVAPMFTIGVVDLNADGRKDLALAADNRATVYFHSASTAGSFGPPQLFGPTGALLAAAADVDADGRADLVVAAGPLTLLLQDPLAPGSFTLGPTIPAGQPEMELALLDLNGDARVDVLMTSRAVLQCAAPAAPGTFDDEALSIAVTGRPFFVDVDGDGRVDLVMIGAAQVRVALQNTP